MLKSGPFKVPLYGSCYFLYPYCNNKYFANCNIFHIQLCVFHLSRRLMLSFPPRRKSDSPCVSRAILACFPSLFFNIPSRAPYFSHYIFLDFWNFCEHHRKKYSTTAACWFPQNTDFLHFFLIWIIHSFLPCLQYMWCMISQILFSTYFLVMWPLIWRKIHNRLDKY